MAMKLKVVCKSCGVVRVISSTNGTDGPRIFYCPVCGSMERFEEIDKVVDFGDILKEFDSLTSKFDSLDDKVDSLLDYLDSDKFDEDFKSLKHELNESVKSMRNIYNAVKTVVGE